MASSSILYTLIQNNANLKHPVMYFDVSHLVLFTVLNFRSIHKRIYNHLRNFWLFRDFILITFITLFTAGQNILPDNKIVLSLFLVCNRILKRTQNDTCTQLLFFFYKGRLLFRCLKNCP